MDLNMTQNVTKRHDVTPIVVGNSISMVCVVLVLVTLTSSKFLRVKRQNIISINLCFSLLIWYIGSLMSALSGHVNSSNTTMSGHVNSSDTTMSGHVNSSDTTMSGHVNSSNTTMTLYTTEDEITSVASACAAGAVLSLCGHFFVMFWLLLDWLFLSFTIRQRVSRHISHFFLKSALLAYGLGSIVVLIFVIWNHAFSNISSLDPHLCWYKLPKIKGQKIAFSSITGLCLLVILACVVYCIVKFTCRKVTKVVPTKIKKTKKILYQLSALTTIIIIGSAPSTSTWFVIEDVQFLWTSKICKKIKMSKSWLLLLDGILVALEGVVLIIYLPLSTGNFKSHWIAVLKGRDPSINSFHDQRNKTVMALDDSAVVANSGEQGEKQTPKIQPRDQQVTFTSVDEVFFSTSSKPSSPDNDSFTRTYSKSQDTEKTNPSGALEKLHSLRKMLSRSSVTRSPSSVTTNETPPQSPTVKKGTYSALERFSFGRQSKTTEELAKKSAF